jgi:two-component system response regulator MprA
MDERRARILAVDDDPLVQDTIRRCLELDGYEVALASDGHSALAEIARERPDLVILDMVMPHLDGASVVMLLRERAATATLPIMVLTARAYAIDKAFGLAVGADDYLAKPFEVAELLARVAALLRRARGEWPEVVELARTVARLEDERDAARREAAELEERLKVVAATLPAAHLRDLPQAPDSPTTDSDHLAASSPRPWWRRHRLQF